MAKNCSKGNSSCPDQNPDLPFAERDKWIYYIVQIVIIIISPCGNSLLIRAFCKFSNLRTASNVIVMSLCVADILIPVSFILHMIQSELKDGGAKLTFCKASAFSSFFLISVIIFHLVLISVDRFVAIKFSLRYHSILTHRRTLIASIAMWLWAALITLVLPQILKAIPNENAADCESLMRASHPCLGAMTKQMSNSSIEANYKIFMKTTQLGIPLVIILSSYSYVYIVSHKHRSHIAAQNDAQRNLTLKQEMKGARILAITVALCLLSLLPLLTLMCLLADGKLRQHKFKLKLKRIAYTLAMGMNAICNPLVYGLGNQQVRQALRRMFKGA